MKKELLQFLTFGLVFLISVINSSFSQERGNTNTTKYQPKKVKSSITYLDSHIQQPNVENCFLVNVIFEVEDVSGGPITNAVVTLNDVENIAGDYIFNGIEAGTYDYSVTIDGYINVDGEVIVTLESSEHIVNITLIAETFTIVFSVIDEDENEITDAIVTFNGDVNEPGEYTFDGVEAGIYDYRVEKAGYITVEAQAEVSDQNLTVNVTLSVVTSTPSNPLKEQWISLFPNPNSGQFTIELSLKPTESSIWITILEPTGRVVYREKVNTQGESFAKELNLSFLSKGIYYIHVQGNQRTGVKMLIIN
jgi:hypothetical protein